MHIKMHKNGAGMEHGQGLSFRMLLGSKWHEKRIAQIGKKGWGKTLERPVDAPDVT